MPRTNRRQGDELRKTILVSGASGIVGYGVLRSLRRSPWQSRLIGTTIYDLSVAPAFCDVCEIAPRTDSPGYMDWLSRIIRKHSVDMVIPGIECDMLLWNTEREQIVSAGALPLLNDNALITLCSDKWAFYQRLLTVNKDYAIPTMLSGEYGAFSAPFLLKPRRGYGSKGIVVIQCKEDFEKQRDRIGSELMMQPIVGSKESEYTVSAFFSSQSKLLDYMALRRKLAPDGYTQEAEVVALDLRRFLEEMADAFSPVGPTNFQFRVVDGQIKLLEINPRISAATSIRTLLGYNESVMSVEYFLYRRLPEVTNRTGSIGRRVVRYIEDCLLPDDRANQ